MIKTNLETTDTIFALTTGSLPSAVAIIKLSGERAFELASKIFSSEAEFSKKRDMWMGKLFDEKNNFIDSVVALSFVSPHSHTGEDVVEFHCHGSVAIVERLERTLLSLGARQATRGEFSYRAFLNSKTNLEELETLGDVFKAKDQIELNAIYSRKSEALALRIANLKDKLIHLQAILDTSVDFSEEYSNVVRQANQPLTMAIHECSLTTQAYRRFEEGTHTPRIVLAGRPNAGKSSLFNALLGRYRAIVNEEAGTTRDAIEEDIYLEGKRFKLVDIAGFRKAKSVTEEEGIRLGENFLKEAAIWLLIVDGQAGLSQEEELLLERFGGKPHILLWNKKDLSSFALPPVDKLTSQPFCLSAKTGEGIESLWNKLEQLSQTCIGNESTVLASASQVKKLERVSHSLEEIVQGLMREEAPELLAEHNRAALRELEDLIGYVDQEEILGKVFSEFCIGK